MRRSKKTLLFDHLVGARDQLIRLEPLTGTLPKGGLHAVGRISDADDLAAAEPGGSSPRMYRNWIGAFGPGNGSLECCGPITCSSGNFIERQRGVFVRLIAYEIPVCSAAPYTTKGHNALFQTTHCLRWQTRINDALRRAAWDGERSSIVLPLLQAHQHGRL